MAILAVVNHPKDLPVALPGVETVTLKAYLHDPVYIQMKGATILNMCRTFRYQSEGYYVSLLALARGHEVLPDITTIQDTKTQSIIRIKSEELDELLQKVLADIEGPKYELVICFGQALDARFQALSKLLYQHFPSPLLRAFFTKRNHKWHLQDVDPIAAKELDSNELKMTVKAAEEFFFNKRQTFKKLAVYQYDIAILVNPDELDSPSNKEAIRKFIRAADLLGMRAWTITKDECSHLTAYDALFIRETTNVNHYTYRIARRAALEGLVVIDDPESILKCSNKVYLWELLDQHKVSTPRTRIITRENVEQVAGEFSFPLILKRPDSAFSQGVHKVKTREELNERVKQMLEKSDLLIAQEFLPTDFDWRIGILNQEPLFACKYYMANKHWQIINADKKGHTRHGKVETFDITDVPEAVVKAALHAANLIGNGLYGVDLKEIDGKPYVIEVNDNPNIDAGIEDKVLRGPLYTRIMNVFLQRIIQKKAINNEQ